MAQRCIFDHCQVMSLSSPCVFHAFTQWLLVPVGYNGFTGFFAHVLYRAVSDEIQAARMEAAFSSTVTKHLKSLYCNITGTVPPSTLTHAIIVIAASQSATLLFVNVKIASEMHFSTLRSLTQPCLTAYCIRCNTPMIQALYHALQISVSLGRCI